MIEFWEQLVPLLRSVKEKLSAASGPRSIDDYLHDMRVSNVELDAHRETIRIFLSEADKDRGVKATLTIPFDAARLLNDAIFVGMRLRADALIKALETRAQPYVGLEEASDVDSELVGISSDVTDPDSMRVWVR